MRTLTLLIAAAVLLVATPGRGAEPAIQIHLPRAIQVEGQTLSLGAISVIRGEDAALAQRAGQVSLGRAPLPKEEIVLDRPTLLGRLASHGIGADRVLFSGAQKVAVSRKETAVSADEMVKAAEACLSQKRPSPPGCRWEVRRPVQALVVPSAGEVRLEARLADHDVAAEAKVEVAAVVGGRQAASQFLIFRMSYAQREAVAAADLAAGTVLTPENVTIRTAACDRAPAADWAAPFGLTTTQPIRAGTVIRPALVRAARPAVAVRRNEGVTMRIRGAGFTVTALGQALEDGRPGESIKVRNVDSNRVVVAKVAADGTVEPALSEVIR